MESQKAEGRGRNVYSGDHVIFKYARHILLDTLLSIGENTASFCLSIQGYIATCEDFSSKD